MPLWIQPLLRAKQEAMESDGLIQSRDTTLVTIKKAQEAQGLNAKVVPVGIFHILRGTKYVAS